MGPFLPHQTHQPQSHPLPSARPAPSQPVAHNIAAQISSARLSAAPNNHLARPTPYQQLQAQLTKPRFQSHSAALTADSDRS